MKIIIKSITPKRGGPSPYVNESENLGEDTTLDIPDRTRKEDNLNECDGDQWVLVPNMNVIS